MVLSWYTGVNQNVNLHECEGQVVAVELGANDATAAMGCNPQRPRYHSKRHVIHLHFKRGRAYVGRCDYRKGYLRGQVVAAVG